MAYFESMNYWTTKKYLKESMAYDLKYPKKESIQQTQISKGETKAVTEDNEIVWDEELGGVPVQSISEKRKLLLALVKLRRDREIYSQNAETAWRALLWPALAIMIPYLIWPLVIAGRWVWRGKKR